MDSITASITQAYPVSASTVSSAIKAFTTLLGSGTVGYISLGVVFLFLSVFYFIFKSKINKWMVDQAAKQTQQNNNTAKQDDQVQTNKEEILIQQAQEELAKFANSAKKQMFDGYTIENLRKYATAAFGIDQVTAATKDLTLEPQIRLAIYKLYKLPSTIP